MRVMVKLLLLYSCVTGLLFLRSMDSEKQNQGKTSFSPETFDVEKTMQKTM